MTVSVAFDGTVIDTADAVTWVGVKITTGGGFAQPTAADAAYEGLNNITLRSDNKRVYAYIDSGTTYDFTTGSTGSGAVKVPNQLFYIWVNFLPSPLLNTQAGGGLGVFMESRGSSATTYSLWYFEGRDTYTGGWIRLCVDPNKTPSATTSGAGGFDPGAVAHFGAFAHNNVGSAKYDNFVIDQCAVGKGLIVTGTSTLGLAEELIADEIANRHGVVTALNKSGTAAQVLGKITLGDSVGTAVTNIVDSDSKFFAAEPKYYQGTLQASCPLDFIGIDIVGNATGATDVVFGSAVGTDNGRNGIALVGNDTYTVGVSRDDGAVESADFYGCSFENITGTIALPNTHDFNSATMSDCGAVTLQSNTSNLTSVGSGQITLNAGVILKDSLLINTVGSSAVTTPDIGLLDSCSFSDAGTSNCVILTGAATTYQWTCLAPNGGDYDAGTAANGVQVTGGSITGNEHIHITASSGTFIIQVASGKTVPSVSSAGAIVNVEAVAISFSFSVSPNITGYEWRLYTVDAEGSQAGAVELAGEESAATNSHSYPHVYTNQPIAVQIIDDLYVESVNYYTLEASNLPVTINLTAETND